MMCAATATGSAMLGETGMGAASRLGPVPLERAARGYHPLGSAMALEIAMDVVTRVEMAMGAATGMDVATQLALGGLTGVRRT